MKSRQKFTEEHLSSLCLLLNCLLGLGDPVSIKRKVPVNIKNESLMQGAAFTFFPFNQMCDMQMFALNKLYISWISLQRSASDMPVWRANSKKTAKWEAYPCPVVWRSFVNRQFELKDWVFPGQIQSCSFIFQFSCSLGFANAAWKHSCSTGGCKWLQSAVGHVCFQQ